MSERWAKGSTAAWRKVRAERLAMDGYRCMIAYPGEWVTRTGQRRRCLGKATQVHHTQDRRVVGDDIRFLRSACAPCNLKTGDPTAGDPKPRPSTVWD